MDWFLNTIHPRQLKISTDFIGMGKLVWGNRHHCLGSELTYKIMIIDRILKNISHIIITIKASVTRRGTENDKDDQIQGEEDNEIRWGLSSQPCNYEYLKHDPITRKEL